MEKIKIILSIAIITCILVLVYLKKQNISKETFVVNNSNNSKNKKFVFDGDGLNDINDPIIDFNYDKYDHEAIDKSLEL